MPLFDELPDKIEVVPEPAPVIDTSTVYQDTGGDRELLTGTQLEGNPWTVNYYAQILGRDDYPNRLDMALDPSLQEYTKVQDMVILLSDSLSPSKDEQQIFTLEGSAIVYPGINVNQWDMFVARIPDGRIGVFTVTLNPEPINVYSYSAHIITFELVSIMTAQYQFELDRKTSDTLYFDPANPTCPGKNAAAVIDVTLIRQTLGLLMDMLYEEYYDVLTRTFIMTVDHSKRYDGSAVEFFRRIVAHTVRGRHPNVTSYSTPTGDYNEAYKTIWDVLSDNRLLRWDLITDRVADIPITSFHSPFLMNGIMMTDISYVVHPGDAKLLWADKPADNQLYTYVFSPGFYAKDYMQMEPHERLVYQGLSNEVYPVNDIITGVKTLRDLSHVERYYRIHIYMWLLIRKL